MGVYRMEEIVIKLEEKDDTPHIVFMGVLSIVQCIFIILKLVNVIKWNWVWVLIPLWGTTALGILATFMGEIIDFIKFSIWEIKRK